jgi:hypothetical protein
MMGFLLRHQPPLPALAVWMEMSDEEITGYYQKCAEANLRGARDVAVVIGVSVVSAAAMALGFACLIFTLAAHWTLN